MASAIKKCDVLQSQVTKAIKQIMKICDTEGISYTVHAAGAHNTYVGKGSPGILCDECDGNWQSDEDNSEECGNCTEGFVESEYGTGWQSSFC